jgi:hypothetical protein
VKRAALALLVLAPLVLVGCAPPPGDDDAGTPITDLDGGIATILRCPDGEPIEVGAGEQQVQVGVDASNPCRLFFQTNGVVLEIRAVGEARLAFDGDLADEPGWFAPRLVTPGLHELVIDADGAAFIEVHLIDHGPPVAEVQRARSLVFTDAALLDDPDIVGLRRLLSLASEDGHGGRLLQAWLARFNTTAHSERAGPALLLEEIEADQGTDATAWDLDALPFTVTAVHNRLDLKNDEHCGELRVSLASTHATLAPFHLIFLFAQSPADDDVSPAGGLHCRGAARRWAALSTLGEAPFRDAARALLADGLTKQRFLLAESVEFVIAPWEWRQWFLTPSDDTALPYVFENRPLFQTVDIEGLNQPGARRDQFLTWLADNAAAVDARTILVPEQFRAPSTRVNAGVPWVPLDLNGLDAIDAQVLSDFPDLRGNLEIVGCHACHATDAEFVQTLPDRTFSPFYDKELDARAVWLDALQKGDDRPVPFGPLQDDPLLPAP